MNVFRITQSAAILICLPCAGFVSCGPRLESISSRDPGIFEKAGSGPLAGYSRSPGDPVSPPELYVKHRDIKAVPVSRGTDTGSLFNSDDERNHLFTPMGPRPGSTIVVNLASNRGTPGDQDPKKKDKSATSGAPGKTSEKPVSGSEDIEEALAKSLPDLAPADKSTEMVSQFNVEVTHVSDNGDVQVLYRRRSVLGDQANEIRFNAKIPYSKIATGEPITTNDLAGVSWVESSDGQVTERKSAGWEDEYSMRLSGFDEAKSRSAMALEDKRKQLLDVRTRLDTRLKTFADERRQYAKQREDLMAKSKENETRLNALQGAADQQKTELERLKPSENPEAKLGDNKDGKNGKK